ncbi:MAG: hypothetical protein OEL56_02430 [Nitrosopumilus sp.]|nr:hypothetical protein [Nitrosopumilus sp.]MDH3489285.1 hypothetical protein [Nitrosopumilus sp.]MDH3516283.1 hypothetical protein [Nitrosopumilus sp.]MDH3564048.1 hypothetical protein [Nitrosopumilus sp.]MDH5417210.1 hypothetical protein [Nitrosopumilus sp.]
MTIKEFHDESCGHADCIAYRKNAYWQKFIEEKTIEEVSQIINLHDDDDPKKLGIKFWDFNENIINEEKTDDKFVEVASQ